MAVTSPPTTNDLEVALIVQSAILPVICLLLGVYARQLGRRDGDDSPRPNDWAAATSVLLMTFGKIAGDLVEAIRKGMAADVAEATLSGKALEMMQAAHKAVDKAAANNVYSLVGLLLIVFMSLKRDRFDSYVIVKGERTKLKRLWGGIIIPNMVAVGVFTAYQYYKLKDVVP